MPGGISADYSGMIPVSRELVVVKARVNICQIDIMCVGQSPFGGSECKVAGKIMVGPAANIWVIGKITEFLLMPKWRNISVEKG